ncbi:hypothetical protein VTI74DRAFT_7825 [Chaetomium olivicolor]
MCENSPKSWGTNLFRQDNSPWHRSQCAPNAVHRVKEGGKWRSCRLTDRIWTCFLRLALACSPVLRGSSDSQHCGNGPRIDASAGTDSVDDNSRWPTRFVDELERNTHRRSPTVRARMPSPLMSSTRPDGPIPSSPVRPSFQERCLKTRRGEARDIWQAMRPRRVHWGG